jgi:hypothetical protein
MIVPIGHRSFKRQEMRNLYLILVLASPTQAGVLERRPDGLNQHLGCKKQQQAAGLLLFLWEDGKWANGLAWA